MDDANIPSLLSLPYLGFVAQDDDVYQRTRKMALSSKTNKWHFSGKDFNGIGGPHVGKYRERERDCYILFQIRSS